jgi:glutathione S-transferase
MTSTAHETLTLLQYAPCLGLRNASPFCIKGDALLALTGQPYVTEVFADPRKAPKGKLPVLRHRGKLIADSTFIRRYLEDTLRFDFDAGLSDAERATADAFVKLCEEHLYWILFYARWMEEANWPAIRDAYFGAIPALVRPLITKQIRKAAFAAMQGHGLGRHTRSELYELGAADLHSLGRFLGDKPFFMGDSPTSADATVYAWMSSIIDAPLESPLKTAAQSHKNLVSYTQRAQQRLFG